MASSRTWTANRSIDTSALADIRESVQELRYYREAVFVPEPGPDTATAREIAARLGGEPPENPSA